MLIYHKKHVQKGNELEKMHSVIVLLMMRWDDMSSEENKKFSAVRVSVVLHHATFYDMSQPFCVCVMNGKLVFH